MLELTSPFWLERFVIFFGGRNGSLGSKVPSEEPRWSASSSFTLASAFRSFGSGALRAVAGAAGGVSEGFDSTTGTATSATASSTATGHSRFARRSCQRSRRKIFMVIP